MHEGRTRVEVLGWGEYVEAIGVTDKGLYNPWQLPSYYRAPVSVSPEFVGGYSRVRHPKKARNSELKTEIVESLSILSLFFPPSPAFHSPMLGT